MQTIIYLDCAYRDNLCVYEMALLQTRWGLILATGNGDSGGNCPAWALMDPRAEGLISQMREELGDEIASGIMTYIAAQGKPQDYKRPFWMDTIDRRLAAATPQPKDKSL